LKIATFIATVSNGQEVELSIGSNSLQLDYFPPYFEAYWHAGGDIWHQYIMDNNPALTLPPWQIKIYTSGPLEKARFFNHYTNKTVWMIIACL